MRDRRRGWPVGRRQAHRGDRRAMRDGGSAGARGGGWGRGVGARRTARREAAGPGDLGSGRVRGGAAPPKAPESRLQPRAGEGRDATACRPPSDLPQRRTSRGSEGREGRAQGWGSRRRLSGRGGAGGGRAEGRARRESRGRGSVRPRPRRSGRRGIVTGGLEVGERLQPGRAHEGRDLAHEDAARLVGRVDPEERVVEPRPGEAAGGPAG